MPRAQATQGVVDALAAEWRRRFAWYPGDWIWPAFLLLLLTIGVTGAAVASSSPTHAASPATTTRPVTTTRPAVTTTTAPVATTAPATTAATTTTTRTTTPRRTPTTPTPPGLTAWPAGRSGYTDVLESIPLAAGRAFAIARAVAAGRRGLPQVGILVSSDYGSLHAGYYVVFSGIFPVELSRRSGPRNGPLTRFRGRISGPRGPLSPAAKRPETNRRSLRRQQRAGLCNNTGKYVGSIQRAATGR